MTQTLETEGLCVGDQESHKEILFKGLSGKKSFELVFPIFSTNRALQDPCKIQKRDGKNKQTCY